MINPDYGSIIFWTTYCYLAQNLDSRNIVNIIRSRVNKLHIVKAQKHKYVSILYVLTCKCVIMPAFLPVANTLLCSYLPHKKTCNCCTRKVYCPRSINTWKIDRLYCQHCKYEFTRESVSKRFRIDWNPHLSETPIEVLYKVVCAKWSVY